MITSKCKAKTKSGQPCNAPASSETGYCFTHSPAKVAERAAARRLGGLHRQTGHFGNTANLPEQVRTLADVLTVLDYTLREIVGLENGINRGKALIDLAEAYVKALSVSELETRIAVLEAAIK